MDADIQCAAGHVIVRAETVSEKWTIFRVVELPPRHDGQAWAIGQGIALDEGAGVWHPAAGNDKIAATITEIINIHDAD